MLWLKFHQTACLWAFESRQDQDAVVVSFTVPNA